MSHVQLTMNADGSGTLLVDGVDISASVKAGTVVVDTSATYHTVGGRAIGPTEVRLTLLADKFEADIADAIIQDEQ